MNKKIILCLSMFLSFILFSYGVDSYPLCLIALGPNVDSLNSKGNYDLYTKENDIALRKHAEVRTEVYKLGTGKSVGVRTVRDKHSIYDVIKEEDIRRDKYGFPVATFFGRDAHFLLGGHYVVFRFLDEEESGMVFLPETCQELIEGMHDIFPSGVEVSCQSYLVEGARHYTTSSLTKTFIGVRRDGGMLFNTIGLPWSEGEKGPGIGVTLSIQFMPGSEIADDLKIWGGTYDTIVIMNGYVDFYRPELFKKNNRVKKVLIKSTDDEVYFEQEYELKDVPEFQTIKFPRRARSVEMTIKEVYNGTHYDDTVITSILPLGRNVTSLGTLDKLYTDPYYVNWLEVSKK